MKNKKLEEILLEFLEKSIDVNRKKELEKILKQSGYNLNELNKLKLMQNSLAKIPVPEPSEKMDFNFYEMLEREKKKFYKSNPWIKWILDWFGNLNGQKIAVRLSYSFSLLFLGWIIGFWFTPNSRQDSRIITMTSEMRQMKEIITLTLLNQPSPTDRIKALNYINDFPTINEEIVQSLTAILYKDPNVNVRLITVEILSKFSNHSKVKESLIESINSQDSPLVQIALADAMIRLDEKDSVKALQQLLERRDLNHNVRKRILHGLQILI